MRFVELPYVLATEEAERIGVDHVARLSSNDSGEASTGTAQFLKFDYFKILTKSSKAFLKIILNDYLFKMLSCPAPYGPVQCRENASQQSHAHPGICESHGEW